MSLTTADAQIFLEQNFAEWVRALNLTFTAIGDTGVTVEMPIDHHLNRVGNILSGQALAALADTAMVFACAAHFGRMVPVATTNLDTRFLRPGVGDFVRSQARVVRASKAMIFAESDMYSEPSGALIAQATATFYIP
ncbi:MAG: thioesterase [Rhodobacterales bacterium]|nr:MAG: thioesterase [Rhodobacterales bacterium]